MRSGLFAIAIVSTALVLCGCGSQAGSGSNSVNSNAGVPIPTSATRIGGEKLRQILPGTTIYGRWTDVNGGWVENYSADGRYFVQFSPPIKDQFGSVVSSAEGTWEVRGNLICYRYTSGFPDGCFEIYESNGTLHYADPVSGNGYAVSTRTEWGRPVGIASQPPVSSAPKVTSTSSGTGFFVTSTNVVTNNHVIAQCTEIHVVVGNDTVRASIQSADSNVDLAVLRLPISVGSIASFRRGSPIRSGDSVVVVGFPLRGLLATEPNVSIGTVSAMAGIGDDPHLMQISAPVQPGSSGGPVVDESGNVVGIVVGKLDAFLLAKATGDIPENVNFAIKSSAVEEFLQRSQMKYRVATSNIVLSASEAADRAKRVVVAVECR